MIRDLCRLCCCYAFGIVCYVNTGDMTGIATSFVLCYYVSNIACYCTDAMIGIASFVLNVTIYLVLYVVVQYYDWYIGVVCVMLLYIEYCMFLYRCYDWYSVVCVMLLCI